jgi:MscS family membrane protein
MSGMIRLLPVLRSTLVVLALVAAPAWGQDGGTLPLPGTTPPPEAAETDAAPAGVPKELASPAAVLQAFVEAMHGADPDFESAGQCMDLGSSTVLNEAAAGLALKLYKCLNRIEVIDFQHDPTIVAAGADAIGDATEWHFFPRDLGASWSWIDGGRRAWRDRSRRFAEVGRLAPEAAIVIARGESGAWRISRETVEGIDDFWSRLDAAGLEPVADFLGTEFVSIAERIENLWPDAVVDRKFLGIEYWQWLTLFVTILAGFVLDFTLRFILAAVSRRLIARRGGEARTETLRRTVRPFGLTAAALLWLFVIGILGLPLTATRILVPAVRLFAMLAVVWSAFRVTDLLAEVASSRARLTSTRFDDLLLPLVRKALKVFIAVFGLIYIANSLDVPLAPLLTGLGIGGAGFAFAAKDTLEHFFGSVTVIADRPFEVGDWVKIGDTEGIVEELGFRSTRVRTFYNSLVTVPNGNLVRAVVDNFGRRRYRRWTTHLTITYGTPPHLIEAFCEGIREIIRLHPYTRKDYYQVWLHQFGAHSLDILLYTFFETPEWNTELRERHRLMMDILRLAERLGVEFAFPTQTLEVIQRDPSAEGGEPPPAPDERADRRARIAGKRAVRALTAKAEWRDGRPPPVVIETTVQDLDDDDGDSQVESKIGGSA